ncbi:type II toxin-antitoxin system VapC family toxin [Nibricoccus sp. IMCC34717]|uniref:type II toxin-antitoxin system VapC family toxin n=1 Tax=Nibricoccus sp. IMCC34717 TaxID=3034021 RepID=UPI00384B4B32
MTYADTSFLFSLILHDTNSAAALTYVSKHRTALAFTAWQRCELLNAVRLCVFRGNCTEADVARAIERIRSDVAAGNLVETALAWPEVMDLAESLSARHTGKLGVRTLDLLHVAAAKSLGARKFVTCDERQLSLARAAGLVVEKV